MSTSLMALAEWHDYQAKNERANAEYAARPSVAPLIVRSLVIDGVTATGQQFGLSHQDLVDWFPEVIYPSVADREEPTADVG